MNRKILTVLYGVSLTAFTIYMAMDTFVISNAYQTNATQINTAMFEVEEESAERGEAAFDVFLEDC